MDFDQDRLSKLGIEFNSDEEASAFSALIQEELEVRIGEEISKRCSDEQLEVFDSLLGTKEASEWLENNVPDYRVIVHQKIDEIEKELIKYGKDIIRSKQNAGESVSPEIDLSVSADNSVKRNDRVITAIYCPKCGKKLIKTSCGDESCGWNPYKSNLICAIKLDNSFVSEINKIKRQEKQNTEITIPDFLRHIPQQEAYGKRDDGNQMHPQRKAHENRVDENQISRPNMVDYAYDDARAKVIYNYVRESIDKDDYKIHLGYSGIELTGTGRDKTNVLWESMPDSQGVRNYLRVLSESKSGSFYEYIDIEHEFSFVFLVTVVVNHFEVLWRKKYQLNSGLDKNLLNVLSSVIYKAICSGNNTHNKTKKDICKELDDSVMLKVCESLPQDQLKKLDSMLNDDWGISDKNATRYLNSIRDWKPFIIKGVVEYFMALDICRKDDALEAIWDMVM